MDDLEMQQYLFDLQGYLVVENVLNQEELKTLNDLIDQQELPPPKEKSRFGSAPDGPGFLQWGKPFCDLLDHPTVMSILRFRLGDCFRLDRIYGINMENGMGRGRLHADYGTQSRHSRAVPGEYFFGRQHEITQGFMVVTWCLSDTGPDVGGFCCIPGSHKSHYKLPQKIYDAPHESSKVIIPHAPAGSLVLFSEALTHGTAAWTGKHHRRSLLYKYCVSQTAWKSNRVAEPTHTELTPRQKILFLPPGEPFSHFPSLFEEKE
ncbi:MAG: hypothetical protein ACI8V2_003036 [Candidatus Latescibacterota bacterium]|jgi:hypothetical protein